MGVQDQNLHFNIWISKILNLETGLEVHPHHHQHQHHHHHHHHHYHHHHHHHHHHHQHHHQHLQYQEIQVSQVLQQQYLMMVLTTNQETCLIQVLFQHLEMLMNFLQVQEMLSHQYNLANLIHRKV